MYTDFEIYQAVVGVWIYIMLAIVAVMYWLYKDFQ